MNSILTTINHQTEGVSEDNLSRGQFQFVHQIVSLSTERKTNLINDVVFIVITN